jgi:hypothetical protein
METRQMRSMKIKVISLCIFINPPVSFLLYVNNFLTTFFSNILGLCSPFSVNEQVSHSYIIMSRIMLLFD